MTYLTLPPTNISRTDHSLLPTIINSHRTTIPCPPTFSGPQKILTRRLPSPLPLLPPWGILYWKWNDILKCLLCHIPFPVKPLRCFHLYALCSDEDGRAGPFLPSTLDACPNLQFASLSLTTLSRTAHPILSLSLLRFPHGIWHPLKWSGAFFCLSCEKESPPEQGFSVSLCACSPSCQSVFWEGDVTAVGSFLCAFL